MSINTDYAQYLCFGAMNRENFLQEVKNSPKLNEKHLESLQRSVTEGTCNLSDQITSMQDKK